MERLTSNEKVSEMSMLELAHNSCYAKDGKVRYRDFESDLDVRELAIKLLEKHADIPNEFTCDEDFDNFIIESLQYGMDDIQGLIAIFYRNLLAMADLRERLKEYEDLEEKSNLRQLQATNMELEEMERLTTGIYSFAGRIEDVENEYIKKVQRKLAEYEDLEEEITMFLCNRKSKYQKLYNRAYKQEQYARKLLEDEPDREDVKYDLNHVIELQDRYNALIDFTNELQEEYKANE